MSFRKLASSLGKNKEGRRGTSNSSTASWSPSNSRSHTPLTSTLSLPESIQDPSLQRYPSPTHSHHSSHSGGVIYNPNQTPLRIVAPFAYNAPPQAYESTSTLSSTDTKDSETATLRLKRSLTKMLTGSGSGGGDDSSHQYHYQKQATPRPSSKKSDSDTESSKSGRRSRKGSFFSSGSLDEQQGTSTSSTKKIVSWIGQKQSGVTKKVQEALRSGGPSSLQGGQSKGRVSNEFHDEEDDRSSISSAPSFVQAPLEDEVSRILSEPDNIPSLPLTSMQAPFQIPAAVYLPRSHTNLHALTLASLAFPPSPHPLLYNPNSPAFPRSSNPSSKLPRLPTFRAHVAKTRILDRLEAQDLTQAENDSIVPFGRQEDFTQKERTPPVLSEGDLDEGRKINDQPGQSVGLEIWTRRASFQQRIRVWQPDTGYNSADGVKYEPVTQSRPLTTVVNVSSGIKALAGLVPSRPSTPSRILPERIASPGKILPPLPPVQPSTISINSTSPRSFDTMVVDDPTPTKGPEPSSLFTPTSATIVVPPVNHPVASPRPLPRPPGPVDPSAITAQQQVLQWQNEEVDSVPIAPIRPLPPRPLPVPPSPQVAAPPSSQPSPVAVSSPQVTIDELESIDGPVLVAIASMDTPQRTSLLSPPGSVNGYSPGSHTIVHSSSTITSAPLTPLDPMETESLRRMSIGSMSVVIPVPGTSGLSLEEMDGLEMTNPHELDNRRRSVVSLKVSVHKRLSMASRASRGSSPSLRNHPLPTLSESSRYSESSHQSSRHTPTGSAATSNEKLNRRTHPSMSSFSFEPPSEPPEQFTSEPSSPVIVAEPVAAMMDHIRAEDQQPLEPSRISEEHVDPFFILQAAKPSQQTLEYVTNGRSSPILSPSQSQRLLSLSVSTDMPTPTAQKPDQKSPLATNGSSPTPSAQSPTRSESLYSVDYDAPRASFSSTVAPIKFIKLKRSASQMAADKSSINGAGISGSPGGKSLQRTLKDPSKFWPHNRRVDEKEEQNARDAILEESGKDESWAAERESVSYPITTTTASSNSRSSMSAPTGEVEGNSDSPVVDTFTTNGAAFSPTSFFGDETDDTIANLPPEVALDVARLSDTSKLDLTLYNPQRSPPVTAKELSRASLSSARSGSDSDSALRAASVKEIAANMALLPSSSAARLGATSRHARTPSSERAARIEAHLESVGASRHRQLNGSQAGLKYLPPPRLNRNDYSSNFVRQPSEDSDRTPMQGSFDSVSQGEDYIEEEPSQDLPTSRYNAAFTPPVSRPPARWSEATWRDRQRSLNTLPLPSASISHSATRQSPFSSLSNRSGAPVSSSTPSIFRPNPSQPGTLHGRSLRM